MEIQQINIEYLRVMVIRKREVAIEALEDYGNSCWNLGVAAAHEEAPEKVMPSTNRTCEKCGKEVPVNKVSGVAQMMARL